MSDEGATDTFAPGQSRATPVNGVAERLKLVREAFGISQRELAKRAGVTNSTISMVELGQVSPSIHSLEKILSVIPLSLSDFFSFDTRSAISVAHDASTRSNEFFAAHRQLQPYVLTLGITMTTELQMHLWDICGVVISGGGSVKTVRGIHGLAQGDCFYIPAQQLHQFINTADIPLKLFLCAASTHAGISQALSN